MNWEGKEFSAKVEREVFFEWLHAHKPVIGFCLSYRRQDGYDRISIIPSTST